MRKPITDRQMLSYWTKRVAELEGMRPMASQEAADEAARLVREAEELEASVATADVDVCETGRICMGDTIEARGRRNAMALGYSRRAVWGNATRAMQNRLRSKALLRIAEEPIGNALAESLAEARSKRDYYAGLVAK